MNNIKWIKNNIDLAKTNAKKRGIDPSIVKKVVYLSTQINNLNMIINDNFHSIKLLSKNKDITISEKKERIKAIKNKIESGKTKLMNLEKEYREIMNNLPNLDLFAQTENPIIVSKNNKRKMKGLPHWEIYKRLNLVSFEWGVNVGGRRFVVYVGKGAKLRRAIIDFQTDIAIKNGYVEVLPPVIATNHSMYNSGHFPKFKEDVFQLKNGTHSLVGSVETSICNFFANTILKTSNLPKKFVCSTLNFRSEVGSAGKDVKGCNRIKQFTKTELFVFSTKEKEEEEFRKMKETGIEVLEAFGVPYRIVVLPPKDISFASRKTVDLEVWFPGEGTYKEVSSISLVGDFQSRRALIRHRETLNDKTELCITLNGTAIAVDRIMAALVETFYNEKNNTITLPLLIAKYFGEKTIR